MQLLRQVELWYPSTMDFLTASRHAADQRKWFRPVGTTGTDAIIAPHPDGLWLSVSQDGLIEPVYLPNADQLFGEWEVVEPEAVLREASTVTAAKRAEALQTAGSKPPI